MTEDALHIRAVVAEAEEGEVLGRINLSSGVITALERAGELQTAIGATIPKKNSHRFKVWFHDYTKEPSSLTESAA